MLNDWVDIVTNFARAHEAWLFPLVFLLAFFESLAIVSLLFPATVVMIALGVLIGDIDYPFWLVWLAGSLGAFSGMWVSYNFGGRHKDNVTEMWPFSKRPHLLPHVQKFFHRWGLWAVFASRFLAPFRATIPMIAGAFNVPKRKYQLVNGASSVAWTLLVLSPGAFGMRWLIPLIH